MVYEYTNNLDKENKMADTRKDIIYADECYKIMGLIFEMYNEIGYGHKENIYQKALAVAFKENKIEFQEQLMVNMTYKDKEIGKYFFDFLVDKKIILELKVRNYFSKKDIEQLYKYLKAANLKLGLIIHFTKDGVKYKRVVNLD